MPTAASDFAVLAATESPTGLIFFDTSRVARWMNDAAQRLLQADLDSINSSSRLFRTELLHEDGRAVDEGSSPLAQTLRTGAPSASVVMSLRSTDGAGPWLEVSARPVSSPAGEVLGAVVACTDVTERVKAKRELRSIFQAMSDGVVVQSRDGAIVDCNPAAERILGLSGDQLAGRTSLDPRWAARREDGSPFPGEDHPAMVALRTGQPQRNVTMSVHRPDGTQAILSINAEPMPADSASPDAVVVTFTDITVHRKAERQTRALLSQVSDLYNNTPCGYHSLDSDGVFVAINDTELDWLGLTRNDAVGKRRAVEFMTPASASAFMERFPAFVRGDVETYECELEFTGSHGQGRHVMARSTRQVDEAGRFVRSRTALTDISDLVRARGTLTQLLRDQEVLLQNEFVGIMRLRGRRFVWVNAAVERMLGYSSDELLGRSTRMMYQDFAGYEAFGRAQAELRHRHGRSLFVDVYAVPFGAGEFVCFLTDQTAMREAQRVLAHAQRMQSVGRLSGGIAHEFNNLLQTISGTAELALFETQDHTVGADLQAIVKAARRGATLVGQLMTYARRQQVAPEVLQLDTIAREAVASLAPDAARAVAVLVGEGPVSAARVDRQSLLLALHNLLENAIEAPGLERRIVIAAGHRVVSVDESMAIPDARAGVYSFLSVTDNGNGMPEEVLGQAMDPFFTTKPFGSNAGLGLSSVYGITTQAGGFVSLTSEPGLGTTATMYFPAVEPGGARLRQAI